MARDSKEGNEVIIPYSTGNSQGLAFGVYNNQNVFIGFRAYVNQEAKIASPLYDIIWSHAILFTKKKRPCLDHDNEAYKGCDIRIRF